MQIIALSNLFLLTFFVGQSFQERIIMKADTVRDYSGMCYDVRNCVPRPVNSTWSIGTCRKAACEQHDSGMLLEVHYTCPRFQKGPTVLCEIIEDKRQEFPGCCPRLYCKSRNNDNLDAEYNEALLPFDKD